MSTRESWESLYDARLMLRAENDALKLRVAVLERALEDVSRKAHAANNRCQALVGVCELAIGRLDSRTAQNGELRKALEDALKGGGDE